MNLITIIGMVVVGIVEAVLLTVLLTKLKASKCCDVWENLYRLRFSESILIGSMTEYEAKLFRKRELEVAEANGYISEDNEELQNLRKWLKEHFEDYCKGNHYCNDREYAAKLSRLKQLENEVISGFRDID